MTPRISRWRWVSGVPSALLSVLLSALPSVLLSVLPSALPSTMAASRCSGAAPDERVFTGP